MDETTQQVSETKISNEDEGGIHRRLRDRNLLRKRKAEAEEKETNQWVFGVESQSKRPKASEKRSTVKRGRPRKLETTPLPAVQEETAVILEDPGVVPVPEDPGTIPDQTTSFQSPLSALVSQPVQEPVQSPVFVSTLPSPVLVNPAPEMTPIQDFSQEAVSDPALSQDSILDPAPAPAPQQAESLSTEPQAKEAFDQTLTEDLGFNEETIQVAPEERRPDEEARVVDLSETRLMSEQSKMYQLPSFSSPPLTKEYLPGN